jgi:hypothetical protein
MTRDYRNGTVSSAYYATQLTKGANGNMIIVIKIGSIFPLGSSNVRHIFQSEILRKMS